MVWGWEFVYIVFQVVFGVQEVYVFEGGIVVQVYYWLDCEFEGMVVGVDQENCQQKVDVGNCCMDLVLFWVVEGSFGVE